MKIIHCFFICIVTLVSACAVAPDYIEPDAPNTKSYSKDDNLISSEQRIVRGKQLTGAWWSLFASEPLNRTITQAISDNYDIAAAKSALAQAEEAVKSKTGALFPQIGVEGIVGRQKYGVALFGPSNFFIPPFTYYEVGPTLNWEIDLFGKTGYSIAYQQALMEYQTHQLDAVYIDLTSNVVAQALEIAAVKAQIAATKQIINEDLKTLQLVQIKYNVGSGTKLEILSAQTQLDNDRALLPPLKQRLSMAQHALAILVGKAPAAWAAPDFELASFTLPKEIPLRLPSQLVRKRPDILAAEANLQAASAVVGIATANMYPSLIISANMLQEALTPHALFWAASNTWAMVGTLTAPIFSGGTFTAEKHKAEHAYQASLAQYQQTILVAFKQVADALTALSNDAEAVTAEQQAVNAASKTLDLAHKSFNAGAIGLLQVQDAQRKLARAQVNLINAQRQRYLDTVQLFVVLGGSPIRERHAANGDLAPCNL